MLKEECPVLFLEMYLPESFSSNPPVIKTPEPANKDRCIRAGLDLNLAER